MPEALHFTGNAEADRADRRRAARAPDRLRPRPAGDGADRVRRAAEAAAAAGRAGRGGDRRAPTRTGSSRCSARSRRSTASPATWRSACRSSVRRRRGGVRRRRRPRLGRRHRHRRPEAPDRGAAGLRRDEGEGARLGARAPVRHRDGGAARAGPPDARRRRLARGAGRVPGREARLQGARSEPRPVDRAPVLPRRRPDRGRRRARRSRSSSARARTSLELALYDIRLHDDAAEIVKRALVGAQDRGVAVRLVYNVDHPGPDPGPAAAADRARACSRRCRSRPGRSPACPT